MKLTMEQKERFKQLMKVVFEYYDPGAGAGTQYGNL